MERAFVRSPTPRASAEGKEQLAFLTEYAGKAESRLAKLDPAQALSDELLAAAEALRVRGQRGRRAPTATARPDPSRAPQACRAALDAAPPAP